MLQISCSPQNMQYLNTCQNQEQKRKALYGAENEATSKDFEVAFIYKKDISYPVEWGMFFVCLVDFWFCHLCDYFSFYEGFAICS